MQTERREPDPIHRVRTRIAPFSTQVQRVRKIGGGNWKRRGAGPFVACVERPCATWYGEVSRRGVKGREYGDPWGEFVRVVTYYEYPRFEV
jgi:hypothetical protein